MSPYARESTHATGTNLIVDGFCQGMSGRPTIGPVRWIKISGRYCSQGHLLAPRERGLWHHGSKRTWTSGRLWESCTLQGYSSGWRSYTHASVSGWLIAASYLQVSDEFSSYICGQRSSCTVRGKAQGQNWSVLLGHGQYVILIVVRIVLKTMVSCFIMIMQSRWG